MVRPPASAAPRLAAAMTPGPPPVSTIQPARAARAPTEAATSSSSGMDLLGPKMPRTGRARGVGISGVIGASAEDDSGGWPGAGRPDACPWLPGAMVVGLRHDPIDRGRMSAGDRTDSPLGDACPCSPEREVLSVPTRTCLSTLSSPPYAARNRQRRPLARKAQWVTAARCGHKERPAA